MKRILLDSDPSRPDPTGSAREACRELERGNIVCLPSTPFTIPAEDRRFLLAQTQSSAAYHKNIAYRVQKNSLTGLGRADASTSERMRQVLANYSSSVIEWMQEVFPWYARDWWLDYASFRPIEEQGRALSPRSRNDLLHVDAFPSRPTLGHRILRFFTNLHPSEPRVWLTGRSMDFLVPRYAAKAGLPVSPSPRECRAAFRERWTEHLSWGLKRIAGNRIPRRSRYDVFMLRFHDYLKANEDYQTKCEKFRWEFPPDSCWIVFTDMVPHAVLSGQFALEMTFIVSRSQMLLPELAPIRILEQAGGFPLGPEPEPTSGP